MLLIKCTFVDFTTKGNIYLKNKIYEPSKHLGLQKGLSLAKSKIRNILGLQIDTLKYDRNMFHLWKSVNNIDQIGTIYFPLLQTIYHYISQLEIISLQSLRHP